jgi:hypothetical protein
MVHKHENGDPAMWQVTDCHAKKFATPVKDEHQDYTLLNAAVTGALMSATLVRRMKPCDLENNIEIRRGLGSFWIFANVSKSQHCSCNYIGLFLYPELHASNNFYHNRAYFCYFL